MKRKICVWLAAVLCIAAALSMGVQAETYQLGDTDLRITVDDSMWYVFTRENIENNAELEELGISYDAIYKVLYDNAAYMDAILYFEDGEHVEFFIRKQTMDTGVVNLSNYNKAYVQGFAKGMAESRGVEEYAVYESQYKFARLEYWDDTYGYDICEFATIVNKDVYVLTFQSTFELTQQEYREIENIVNSAEFDVDPSLREKNNDGVLLGRVIGGAVVGGVVGAVISITSKKKRGKSNAVVSVETKD